MYKTYLRRLLLRFETRLRFDFVLRLERLFNDLRLPPDCLFLRDERLRLLLTLRTIFIYYIHT